MNTLPVVRERLPLRRGNFSAPVKQLSPKSAITPLKKTSDILPEDRELTKKQKAAVEYLISGQAKTQREAGLMAGYSEVVSRMASTEIFAKPNVRKEYNRRRKELWQNMELTSQDIVNRLQMLADANPADYIKILPDGSFKFDLSNVTREQLGLIETFEFDALGRPKLKLHNTRACLMDIAKLKGIGSEVVRAESGPLTIQALDAIIAQSTTNNIVVNQQINVTEKESERYLPPRRVIEQQVQQ